MDAEILRRRIEVALGKAPAELVLKNAQIVNVFTGEVETADVAIDAGIIVGIGQYQGETEQDLTGRFLCSGFVDGHIHLESAMVAPVEFEKAVVPHGTTAVITDPHEIANVAGVTGISYMLDATHQLDLDVYFMLPSCVPDSQLDESGAVLRAHDLEPYLSSKRVLGLAELMDAPGLVQENKEILYKLDATQHHAKQVDGHAPMLAGPELNAYIAAGVHSDHECSSAEEALEKLRRGQYIMVREGTAAHNLEALMPLFQPPYCHRCMLVTDDKHPSDLLEGGHIDYIIRKAVRLGANPIDAIRMASLVPAQYFGLADHGAVAPGYAADLVVLDNLQDLQVLQVYKAGRLTAENGKKLPDARTPRTDCHTDYPTVTHSFDMQAIVPEQLTLPVQGTRQRVIQLMPGELLTEERIVPFAQKPDVAPGVDVAQDIIKLACFERHHHTGHVGLGFLGGYGLRRGAVASSIAHDSHNLIVAGTNDADMLLAGEAVRRNEGGLAFALDGQVVAELPLLIGGLMSDAPLAEVNELLERMKALIRAQGVPEGIDPFMTLAFASLPVIPALRLNTYGVVDVAKQAIVPPVFD